MFTFNENYQTPTAGEKSKEKTNFVVKFSIKHWNFGSTREKKIIFQFFFWQFKQVNWLFVAKFMSISYRLIRHVVGAGTRADVDDNTCNVEAKIGWAPCGCMSLCLSQFLCIYPNGFMQLSNRFVCTFFLFVRSLPFFNRWNLLRNLENIKPKRIWYFGRTYDFWQRVLSSCNLLHLISIEQNMYLPPRHWRRRRMQTSTVSIFEFTLNVVNVAAKPCPKIRR